MFGFEKYKDNVAVITENEMIITYEKLEKDCKKLGERVHGRCFVIVICDNEYAALVGYLSMIKNKCITLLLPADIGKSELSEIIDRMKPTYVWCKKNIINEEISHAKSIFWKWDYELYKLEIQKNIYYDKEIALLLSTSGSLGKAKFVKLSYQNIYSNAVSIGKYLDINNKSITISSLPMCHAYGLSIINSYILAGGKLVLTTKSMMEHDFWNLFIKYKVNSLSGVPYSYEILKRNLFLNKSYPYLRVMTQAGGKLDLSLQELFAKYALKNNIKFYIMYGQTEATARIAYLPCELVSVKLGCIGKAIPGGKILLIDEKNNIVSEPYKEGELVYYGENVMMGYAQTADDLQKGDVLKGELFTGDMAYMDESGLFYIVGRKKRFIKIHGIRLGLDEVEMDIKNIISGDVACIGKDDKLIIFYTTANDEIEIKKFAREKKIYNKNYELLLINEVPLTKSLKKNYKKLFQYYEEEVEK